jgi:hypothetical protein
LASSSCGKWQRFSCRLEKRLLIVSNLHSDHREAMDTITVFGQEEIR